MILIHCHLFKNAGTTFDWSLTRSFGPGFVEHLDDQQMKRGRDYLGPFLKQNDWITAVSSHHVRFPLPEMDGIELLAAVILRHPIDRAGSVYAFERKQEPAATPGAQNAKRMTFPEYVLWRMNPKVGVTIRDFQTRMCSGRMASNQLALTPADLESAKKCLHDTPLLGLVERYDESMVLMEIELRPYFPDIDLSYSKQNVSADRGGQLQDRIRRVSEDLSPEAWALLVKNNRFDQILYEEAQLLLEERITQIEDFPERLAAFREKCGVLNKPRARTGSRLLGPDRERAGERSGKRRQIISSGVKGQRVGAASQSRFFPAGTGDSEVREGKARRFVIIAPARTGSTMLRLMLNSHPRICCHGEVLGRNRVLGFSPKATGLSQSQSADDLSKSLLWERGKDPVRFLRTRVFSASGFGAVGFKMLYMHYLDHQFFDTVRWLKSQRDIHVVFLNRRNMLKRYVSELAFRAGAKTTLRGSPIPKQLTFRIDPALFIADLKTHQETAARLGVDFKRHSSIEVWYEDIVQDREDACGRMFRFLEVEEHTPELLTEKVNRDDLQSIIDNYHELKANPELRPFL